MGNPLGTISGGSGGVKTGDIGGKSAAGGNDKLTSGGISISMGGGSSYASHPYAQAILESMGMGGSAVRQATSGLMPVLMLGGVGFLLYTVIKKKK